MAGDKNKYTIRMHPETWEKVKELYKRQAARENLISLNRQFVFM